MISKFSFTLYFVIISYFVAFGQTSTPELAIITEEISEEITEIIIAEKTITTRTAKPTKKLVFNATVWPNPSNIGKVRLSIENLPKEPLFIQIFNDKSELIQEGMINGSAGANLQHTLSLPDTSGSYSIKLSDNNKIIKDLELEIL